MRRAIEIASVLLFNLSLLFVAIAIPALILLTSEGFYKSSLVRTGIYSSVDENGETVRAEIEYVGGDEDVTAIFEDYQIDMISSHIIGFLSGEVKSFDLVLDDVYIVGEGECDNVRIFGDDAISHMNDVLALVGVVRVLTVVFIFIAALGIILYVIFIRKLTVSAHRISRIFYASLLSLCVLFLLFSFVSKGDTPFLLNLWQNLHYVIFPFQNEKVESSELMDALPVILSTEFFIGAVIIVFAVFFAVALFWLLFSFFYERKCGRQLNSDFK